MLLRLFLVLSLCISLTSCVVKQSTYKEALAEIQNLKSERDGLLDRIKEIEANLDRKDKEILSLTNSLKLLEENKNKAEARIKELEQETTLKLTEIVNLKKAVEDIRVAKEKEREDIKYKVKEVQTRAETLLEKIEELLKILQ